MTPSRSAFLLAGTLVTTGTLHFLAPKPFDSIVPRSLPGSSRTWTYVSGAAELACAGALAHPRTRRTGALATAGLLTAVFPANIKMAADFRSRPKHLRYGAYARLPMQLPLIKWALSVRANTPR